MYFAENHLTEYINDPELGEETFEQLIGELKSFPAYDSYLLPKTIYLREKIQSTVVDPNQISFGTTIWLYTSDYQDFFPLDIPSARITNEKIAIYLPDYFRENHIIEGKEFTVYQGIDENYENPSIVSIQGFLPADLLVPRNSRVGTNILTSDLFQPVQEGMMIVNEEAYQILQEKYDITESPIKILYIRMKQEATVEERAELIDALRQHGSVEEVSEIIARSEDNFRAEFFRRLASVCFMSVLVCIILLGQILLLINKTLRQQSIFYLVGSTRSELMRNTVLTASLPLLLGLLLSVIVYLIYRWQYILGKVQVIYFLNFQTLFFPILLFLILILIIVGDCFLYMHKLRPVEYLRSYQD